MLNLNMRRFSPPAPAAPAAAGSGAAAAAVASTRALRRLVPCSTTRTPAASSCSSSSSSCAPAAAAEQQQALHALLHNPRPLRQSMRVASASGDSGASNPGDEAPKTVSLVRRFPGIGYTFVLAGFLKILTMASLTSSAPVGAVRSALGHNSQFLLVPGGLLLCWIAKQIVDRDLQDSPKFMAGLVVGLVFMYFFIYKLLYRYDVVLESVQRARPVSSSNMAEVRARAGDRDLSGLVLRDSRSYDEGAEQKGQYSDLAYYEGRYPSQVQAAEQAARAGGAVVDEGAGGTSVNAARPAPAEMDARSALRRVYRRAPGSAGSLEQDQGDTDAIMRPR